MVRLPLWNCGDSWIDVEDREMMVDYEQFSKMLLGTALEEAICRQKSSTLSQTFFQIDNTHRHISH
jgi:hypothetical protein